VQIALSGIPGTGRQFEGQVELTALNARLAAAPNNEILFTEPPKIDVMVIPRGTGATISGIVKGRYERPCRLCLEPVIEHVEILVDLFAKPLLAKDSRALVYNGELGTNEEGVIYIQDQTVDLQDYLEESLIVALPFFSQDHEGCKGLDTKVIEASKAPKSTLGDILKSAGIAVKPTRH